MPRVSVIIPAFNYGQYLGDALESLLSQTLSDWDCVVVDDGSTDDTAEVARRFTGRDSRIRYIHQENRGLPAARNAGVRNSAGQYLQFLDADDRLEAAKLEFHARFLDVHPRTEIVYGFSTFFPSSNPDEVLYSVHGRLSRPLLIPITSRSDALNRVQMYNIMPVPSALIRRGVWDDVGGFNEKVRSAEDWDFWLRAAIAGHEFHFADAEGARARVRVHPQSMSRSTERMILGLIDAARSFGDTPAAALWNRAELPLIYEVAGGIDDVRLGRRRQGASRIFRAAREATSGLMRLRWMTYAGAATILPRPMFWWLVTRPMPERGLEILRSISGSRHDKQSASPR